MIGPSVWIALLGVFVTYVGIKSQQFQRPSEIRDSVQQAYTDYRVQENAGFMYRATRVLAQKPGFPERLYKFIPLVRREGFVEIEFVLEPSPGQETVTLPSPKEIEQYGLFPSNHVEIRQATWTDSPLSSASLLVRVSAFNDREVINLAHPVLSSIAEIKTGEIDREYHAQFLHTEIERQSEKDS